MSGVWLISYVALWFVVLLLVGLLIGVLRHVGILYQQLPQRSAPPTKLQAGDTLPDVALSTSEGRAVRLSAFVGLPASFVVISPQCSACDTLLGYLREADLEGQSSDRRVIVSTGDADATAEMLRKAEIPLAETVLFDPQSKIKSAWGVQATPVTVMVDGEFTVVRQIIGAVDPRHMPPVTPTNGTVERPLVLSSSRKERAQ